MTRWGDSGTWVGDQMRREAFFFSSRGVELFGSLYMAAELTRPLGIIACNSWGAEGNRADLVLRMACIELARRGGAGLLFHYPGYGDSHGDLADATLADLSAAAGDAVEQGMRRCPGVSWILAGCMLGASVACLAQRQAAVDTLLLVQPALRPAAYFQRLAKTRSPLAPGPSPREMMHAGTTPGMAYGYPIPRHILELGQEADAAVGAALEAFDGEGVIIRHEKPPGEYDVPEGFEQVDVPGTWRFGSHNNPELTKATVKWLGRRVGEGKR
jgi:alpha/beta superfamily hydrolase